MLHVLTNSLNVWLGQWALKCYWTWYSLAKNILCIVFCTCKTHFSPCLDRTGRKPSTFTCVAYTSLSEIPSSNLCVVELQRSSLILHSPSNQPHQVHNVHGVCRWFNSKFLFYLRVTRAWFKCIICFSIIRKWRSIIAHSRDLKLYRDLETARCLFTSLSLCHPFFTLFVFPIDFVHIEDSWRRQYFLFFAPNSLLQACDPPTQPLLAITPHWSSSVDSSSALR